MIYLVLHSSSLIINIYMFCHKKKGTKTKRSKHVAYIVIGMEGTYHCNSFTVPSWNFILGLEGQTCKCTTQDWTATKACLKISKEKASVGISYGYCCKKSNKSNDKTSYLMSNKLSSNRDKTNLEKRPCHKPDGVKLIIFSFDPFSPFQNFSLIYYQHNNVLSFGKNKHFVIWMT